MCYFRSFPYFPLRGHPITLKGDTLHHEAWISASTPLRSPRRRIASTERMQWSYLGPIWAHVRIFGPDLDPAGPIWVQFGPNVGPNLPIYKYLPLYIYVHLYIYIYISPICSYKITSHFPISFPIHVPMGLPADPV